MIRQGLSIGISPNEKRPINIQSGITISVNRYCKEVEELIRVAKLNNYILPADYQLRVLSNTINELKSAGIWTLYDVAYAFGYNSLYKYANAIEYDDDGLNILFPTAAVAAERPRSLFEQFTFLNLKNPLLYQCSYIKGPARPNYPFYSEKGWCSGNTGGGTDFGGLSTNWVAKDNGVNWTQNNAGMFCYLAKDNDIAASYCIGDLDSVNTRTSIRLMPYGGSGQVVGIINGNNTTRTYVSAGGVSTAKGFHRLERTSSTLSTYYRDGTSLGTSAGASASMLSTLPPYICCYNQDGARFGGVVNPVGCAGFGASLGATLVKIESDIWTNFLSKTQSV